MRMRIDLSEGTAKDLNEYVRIQDDMQRTASMRLNEINEKLDKIIAMLDEDETSRYEEIRDEAERDYYEEKPTGLVVLGRLVFNVSRLIEHYAYDCSLQSFPTRDFIRAVRFCELYAKDQGHEFTCETPTRSEENPLTTIPSDLQFVVQGFINEDYDMVKIGLEGIMRVADYA